MAWRGFTCAALDGALADLAPWRQQAAASAARRGPVAEGDEAAAVLQELETDRALRRMVLAGGVTFRPGAATFLAACAARGPVGLVTTLPRDVAESLVSASGLGDGIAFLLCASEGGATPWRRAAERGRRAATRAATRTARPAVALVGDAAAAAAAERAGFAVVHVGAGGAGPLPAGTVRWPDFRGKIPDDLPELPPPLPT